MRLDLQYVRCAAAVGAADHPLDGSRIADVVEHGVLGAEPADLIAVAAGVGELQAVADRFEIARVAHLEPVEGDLVGPALAGDRDRIVAVQKRYPGKLRLGGADPLQAALPRAVPFKDTAAAWSML